MYIKHVNFKNKQQKIRVLNFSMNNVKQNINFSYALNLKLVSCVPPTQNSTCENSISKPLLNYDMQRFTRFSCFLFLILKQLKGGIKKIKSWNKKRSILNKKPFPYCNEGRKRICGRPAVVTFLSGEWDTCTVAYGQVQWFCTYFHFGCYPWQNFFIILN